MHKKIEAIGILTGGGDCPGLNAAIRAVVYAAHHQNIKVVGFFRGWKGLIEKNYQYLDLNSVFEILPKGGTILGSLGFNPLEKKEWISAIKETFSSLHLDACIVIGGDITLSRAYELYRKENLPLIAIPKTIDNDIVGTDRSIGFDTAVSVVTEALDRIYTTAQSHERIMIVEVMGHHMGWIATYAGIAGGADVILIPEVHLSLKEIISKIKMRQKRGKFFSMMVVAEGASVKADRLAKEIQKKTRIETRVTVLGHVQRGGSPSAYDRILATQYGAHAVRLAAQKKFGQMVALHGNKISAVPLKEVVNKNKKCDLILYQTAQLFFG